MQRIGETNEIMRCSRCGLVSNVWEVKMSKDKLYRERGYFNMIEEYIRICQRCKNTMKVDGLHDDIWYLGEVCTPGYGLSDEVLSVYPVPCRNP